MEVLLQCSHPGGQDGTGVVMGLAVGEAKERKKKNIEVHINIYIFYHENFRTEN